MMVLNFEKHHHMCVSKCVSVHGHWCMNRPCPSTSMIQIFWTLIWIHNTKTRLYPARVFKDINADPVGKNTHYPFANWHDNGNVPIYFDDWMPIFDDNCEAPWRMLGVLMAHDIPPGGQPQQFAEIIEVICSICLELLCWMISKFGILTPPRLSYHHICVGQRHFGECTILWDPGQKGGKRISEGGAIPQNRFAPLQPIVLCWFNAL